MIGMYIILCLVMLVIALPLLVTIADYFIDRYVKVK